MGPCKNSMPDLIGKLHFGPPSKMKQEAFILYTAVLASSSHIQFKGTRGLRMK